MMPRQLISNHKITASLAISIAIAAVRAYAQYNIDIELGGNPALGGGTPTSQFGGAAGQVGYWNATTFSLGPDRLRDLRGQPGPVYYHSLAASGYGGLSRNVQANTGDYAALLNDGLDTPYVRYIWIEKLRAGTYDVYTYGIATWAPYYTWTEVTIPSAILDPIRVRRSPVLGNQFIEGQTHTIHRVRLRNHQPLEIIVRPTIFPYGATVSGIQIVPVPE